MQGYYGLGSNTKENCCEIKENSEVGKKCGQFDGGCQDQNDCLDGFTCSPFVNSSKLDKFMCLPTYYPSTIL